MKKHMTFEEFFKTQSLSTEKNNKPKLLRHFLALLCFSIILFSLYTIFKWFLDNSQIRQINEKIQKNIKIEEIKDDGTLINPPYDMSSNYWEYIKIPFYNVDIKSLKKENNDTIAFIHMNNTNVDYPIVQTEDNNYYLNHAFDKSNNEAGWIFMDWNNQDFLDDNTVIYGHARIDGTMFGSLRNVLTSYWQNNDDNYVIFISTLKENMLYQIFSIYTIKKENYYIKTHFKSKKEKEKWLQEMQKRNISPINTEVNGDDKILTLSTCKNNKGERIVIQAKLIKKKTI